MGGSLHHLIKEDLLMLESTTMKTLDPWSFSFQANITVGTYQRYYTIKRLGDTWYASVRNDHGFSSLLMLTLHQADSFGELMEILTGRDTWKLA